VPVSWAPGQGVTELPEGVGFRVKKDDWLVLQVHYNLVDPELAGSMDQTTVHVRYADSVEREGYFDLPDDFLSSLFSGDPAELPPGEPAATYTFDYASSTCRSSWPRAPTSTACSPTCISAAAS
jgi:hypothetical protein